MTEKVLFRRIPSVVAVVSLLLALTACGSSAPAVRDGPQVLVPEAGGDEISAGAAIGGLERADVPLFTGAGGSGMRLVVSVPEARGEVPDYLPVLVQGLLSRIFGRYSGIGLVERQHLDAIIAEQDMSLDGRFSDEDFISIGHLANANYMLLGTIQRLTGDQYSLQFHVTNLATGLRRTTSPVLTGTVSQFHGRGTLVNEAAVSLLNDLGVNLTEAGRQSLLAGDRSAVQAEMGMARGIAAMRGGDEIEALLNISQAIAFDPANLEARARLNTISAGISGGTLTERIVGDIAARNLWLDIFRETAGFFDNHPPFEITFDPNLVQIGEADWALNTVDIGMRIALDPAEAGFEALNTLIAGLDETGRRDAWGFSGWPLQGTPAGTVVFGGRSSFSYNVNMALINELGQNIGNGTITLTSHLRGFSAGNRTLQIPLGAAGEVRFSGVRVSDMTPAMTVAVLSVNGVPAGRLSAAGYMRIDAGPLGDRFWEVRLAQAQAYLSLGQAQAQSGRRRAQLTEAMQNVDQAISDFEAIVEQGPAALNEPASRGLATARINRMQIQRSIGARNPLITN